MKKITLLFLLISTTLFSQVETELTNYLNLPCNVSVCEDIQLGACDGDLNSQGNPIPFTDYQVYYVTENINLQYNSLTLRNSRLEFRNGASLIDNGIEVIIENDCDAEDNITQLVFIGGGNRFSSMAEYLQTLSIKELELQGYKPIKIIYYDLSGKRLDNIKHQSKGIYLQSNLYKNGVIVTEKTNNFN